MKSLPEEAPEPPAGESLNKAVLTRLSAHLPKSVRRVPFWLVVGMLIFCGLAEYSPQLGVPRSWSLATLGFTRQTFVRILYLLPIAYASRTFGLPWGIFAAFVSLLIMLPRVILWSPAWVDALAESMVVVVLGILVSIWYEAQGRQTAQREEALTKLQKAQEELQAQVFISWNKERRLAALNAVARLVAESLEVEDILRRVTDKVAEVMQVDFVLVFLINRQTEMLEMAAYKGATREFVSSVGKLRIGEGFNGQVALTGEPLVVQDASSDPRLTREVVRQEGIQSELIVPLRAKGKVVGTLCVAVRSRRQFLPEEVDLLVHIGNTIGMAVENAYLYAQEREARELCFISEQKYRELFENASDAIWIHDMEGIIQDVNRAVEKLTGYPRKELVGSNMRQYLSPSSLALARGVKRRLLSEEAFPQPYEQHIIKRDGTEAVVMVATTLVTSHGQPQGFHNIARDVTEEKRMQESLRFYLQAVVRAQEDERKRIARELHDDTAQALGTLSRQVDNFLRTRPSLPQGVVSYMSELRQKINLTLEGVHRFSQDLRPSILDDLGLLPAVRWLTSQLVQDFGIAVETEIVGEIRRFPPEIELLLFRIVQEALSNVRRHSQASQAKVRFEFGDRNCRVTISDNGKGFEVPERVGELPRIGKLGLVGIHERVRLLGGTLELQSKKDAGTTLTVEVPV